MGLVALQAGPINRAFTQCVSNVSQIKAKITNSMFTLITLLCNTTVASVSNSVRPRVKVSQRNIEDSFLYDTGAQKLSKGYMALILSRKNKYMKISISRMQEEMILDIKELSWWK